MFNFLQEEESHSDPEDYIDHYREYITLSMVNALVSIQNDILRREKEIIKRNPLAFPIILKILMLFLDIRDVEMYNVLKNDLSQSLAKCLPPEDCQIIQLFCDDVVGYIYQLKEQKEKIRTICEHFILEYLFICSIDGKNVKENVKKAEIDSVPWSELYKRMSTKVASYLKRKDEFYRNTHDKVNLM